MGTNSKMQMDPNMASFFSISLITNFEQCLNDFSTRYMGEGAQTDTSTTSS